MSGTTCQRCTGKSIVFLCRACESDLRKMLLHLSWLIDRLAEKALGQTRQGESVRRSSDLTTPMPCNLGASADLDRIHALLVRWVQDICETRGVAYPGPRMVPREFIGPLFQPLDTEEDKRQPQFRGHATHATRSAAIWLANNTGAIACDEAAGMCCDEVRDAVELVVTVINRPEPTERILGRCPVTLTDNYGQRICGTDLTAARSATAIQCPTCKTTYGVAELHARQLEASEGMSFTLSELFKTILPINNEYVALRTLQHWAARGTLVPTGYSAEGDPRFLLADVRRLRDRKPQKAATGAAAEKYGRGKAS